MDNGYSETFATYEFADKGTYVCMQCGGENKIGIVTVKQGRNATRMQRVRIYYMD